MPPPAKATVIFSSVPQKTRTNLLRSAVTSAAAEDVGPAQSEQTTDTHTAVPSGNGHVVDIRQLATSSVSQEPSDEYDAVSIPTLPAIQTRSSPSHLDTASPGPDVRPGGPLKLADLPTSFITELKALNGKSPLRSPGAQRPPRSYSNGQTVDTSKASEEEEISEQRYLSELPEQDAQGRVIPAWKRQLMARRMVEETRAEREERAAREREETRLAGMPRWKRELEARKATPGSSRPA